MSTPPPAPTPAPEPSRRTPWWRRRVTAIAAAAVVLFVAAAVHANGGLPSSRCVVNGYGNVLCDEEAVAYCRLLARHGMLATPSTDAEWPIYRTCTDVGWDDPNL